MSKSQSEDPSKPSQEEDELQEGAMVSARGITHDITGEVHVNPEKVEESDTRIYVVRKGDTLGKIARRCYGDANQYERIIAANRDRLGDNDEPIVGSELRIPPAG